MATFHEMEEGGRKVIRCFVKGAPDVLLARATVIRDADGNAVPADDFRDRVLRENDRLASEGLRVLAVASRDIDPAAFDPAGTLLDEVQGLTLIALIGIVDPPRKEARDAIALCREAGIRARMITGDHVTTASAIAQQLGIEGRALSGTEFAAMSDAELDEQVDEHRRRRARRAGGQGASRRHAEAEGQRRLDDRRRRERRAGAQARRHRCRDGDHRDRGDQGSRRHDPHRRQLRHHRLRGRGRPRHLRQPDEVRPRPADPARLRSSCSSSARASSTSRTASRSRRCRSSGSTSRSTSCSRSGSASTRQRPG